MGKAVIIARYFDVNSGLLKTITLPNPLPTLRIPVKAQDLRHTPQHREFHLGMSPFAHVGLYDYFAGPRT